MFLFQLGRKGKRRKKITKAVFCGDHGQVPHSRMVDLLPSFLQNCISSFEVDGSLYPAGFYSYGQRTVHVNNKKITYRNRKISIVLVVCRKG